MVLISVDLPQPFGPKMHTCSPHAISRSMPWRAARSPRITLTRLKESRGARVEFILGSIAWTAAGPRGANDCVILTERGYHARVHGKRKNRGGEAWGRNRRKRSSCLILKQPAETCPKNKKEVKTGSFSPPGVGGVLHDNSLGGSAVLPCQAGLRPHSRTAFGNSLGDSPPKSLPFCAL